MNNLIRLMSLLMLGVVCVFGTAKAQMHRLHIDTVKRPFTAPHIRAVATKNGADVFWATHDSTFTYLAVSQDSGKTFTRRIISPANTNNNGYAISPIRRLYVQGLMQLGGDTLLLYGEHNGHSTIYRSTNNGLNWTVVHHNQPGSLFLVDGMTDMAVLPSNGRLYAVDFQRIWQSADRGASWTISHGQQKLTNIEVLRFNRMAVYSRSFQSVGVLEFVDQSQFGGWMQMFVPQEVTMPREVFSISKLNDNEFYFSARVGTTNEHVAYKGRVVGGSWQKIGSSQNDDPIAGGKVHFVNDSVGYTKGGEFTIWRTSDSGRIFEEAPRSHPFFDFHYPFSDFAAPSPQHVIAVGRSGLVESTVNGGGVLKPKALLRVDTSQQGLSTTVFLTSRSKPHHQHRWLVNGQVITHFRNGQYSRSGSLPTTVDTIQLIVTNSLGVADTAMKLVEFPYYPVLSSVTPDTSIYDQIMEIRGLRLGRINAYWVGGTRIYPYLLSDTLVRARLVHQSRGALTVHFFGGSYTHPLYHYAGMPLEDRIIGLTDSTFCTNDSVKAYVANSQRNVWYKLNAGYLSKPYESKFVKGTGDTIWLVLRSVEKRDDITVAILGFWDTSNIHRYSTMRDRWTDFDVQHTKARFHAQFVNSYVGESVAFQNTSIEAAQALWRFQDNNVVTTSNLFQPPNITYQITGQKTATLIVTSNKGCVDSITIPTVHVLDSLQATSLQPCAVQLFTDSLDIFSGFRPEDAKVLNLANGGKILMMKGFKRILPSRFGSAHKMPISENVMAAHYDKRGVLRWILRGDHGHGFSNAVEDPSGNLYLTTYVNEETRLYPPASPSIATTELVANLYSPGDMMLLLKVSPLGKLVWRGRFHASAYGDSYSIYSSSVPRSFLKFQAGKIFVQTKSVTDSMAYYSPLNVRTRQRQPTNNPFYANNDYCYVLDTAGTCTSSFAVGHNGSGNRYPKWDDIIWDSQGNTYVSGAYNHDNLVVTDANQQLHNLTLNRQYGPDGHYLIKLNHQFTPVWSLHFQQPGIFSSSSSLGYNSIAQTVHLGLRSTKRTKVTIYRNQQIVDSFDQAAGMIMDVDLQGNIVRKTSMPHFPYAGLIGVHNDTAIYHLNRPGSMNTQKAFVVQQANQSQGISLFANRTTYAKMFQGKLVQTIGFQNDLHDEIATLNSEVGGRFRPSHFSPMYYAGLHYVFNSPVNYPIMWGGETIVHFDFQNCSNRGGVPPIANAGSGKVSCANAPVQIGAHTDTVAKNYLWLNAEGSLISTQPNPTVAPSVPTTYYLTVTNAAGLIATDSVRVGVNAAPALQLGRDTSLCNNVQYTLQSNATGNVQYAWTSNPAGFSSTQASPTITVANGVRHYSLTITDSIGCTTTKQIRITGANSLTPTLSIRASKEWDYCLGDSITYTAEGQYHSAASVYQWKYDGQAVGGNQKVLRLAPLVGPKSLELSMVANLGCATNNNPLTRTAIVGSNPIRNDKMLISSTDTFACAGSYQSAVFKMTFPNTSSGFGFQRSALVNGVPRPMQSAMYIDEFRLDSLQPNDVVTVAFKAPGGCQLKPNDTTNSIIMRSRPTLAPFVSIQPPQDIPCAGLQIFMKLQKVNGGLNPQMTVLVDGIAGTTVNHFTDTTVSVSVNDTLPHQYQVRMTTTQSCHPTKVAVSNTVTVKARDRARPEVAISGTTQVMPGAYSVITPQFAGAAPQRFIWQDSTAQRGWQNYPNQGSTIAFFPTATGHALRVQADYPWSLCAVSGTLYSNTLRFTLLTTPVAGTNVPMIAPNPVRNRLMVYGLNKDVKVRSISIINSSGQTVHHAAVQPQQQTLELPTFNWAAGIYRLVLTDADGKQTSLNFVKL